MRLLPSVCSVRQLQVVVYKLSPICIKKGRETLSIRVVGLNPSVCFAFCLLLCEQFSDDHRNTQSQKCSVGEKTVKKIKK